MKEIVETLVKAYDKEISGSSIDYVVTSDVKLKEGATLYLFEGDGIKSSAIAYEDGTVFVLTDWQNGCPETAEEVGEYEWCRIDGRPVIMMNGLPRTL